jgi:hypothetical protein
MVLVEEKLYDEMWKRSPVDTSKSYLNTNLHSQLDSSKVPDDVKVKHYQMLLNRFLNLKQQVPKLHPFSLNGSVEETPPRSAKKRNLHWLGPVRNSRRKHIKWSRHDE